VASANENRAVSGPQLVHLFYLHQSARQVSSLSSGSVLGVLSREVADMRAAGDRRFASQRVWGRW